MSVKRDNKVVAVVLCIVFMAHATIGTSEMLRTLDRTNVQKATTKDVLSELEKLKLDESKLDIELKKASEQKEADKQEIEKLRQRTEELQKEKEELEVQAKIKSEDKLAQASERIVNVVTLTATASAQSGDMESVVRSAAEKHGLSADYMVKVAMCESTLNPDAVNRNYYAGGGNPTGLYQFLPETWNRISSRSPYGQQPWSEVKNGYINAHITAWAFANGYSGEWECA